jgi:hypothetical protein
MARHTSADRVTEHKVADAVCKALATEAGREASIQKLVLEVPNFLKLSAADLAQSPTRKNEALWEQQIRNIQSHHVSPGNFIHEGFLESTKGGLRLTDAGVRRLEEKGLI